MNRVKVYYENKKWKLAFSEKVKEYPIKSITLNRAKFEAMQLAPCILEIYDKNMNLESSEEFK